MTPRVDVDRGFKGFDVESFLNPPFDPVLFRIKGDDVVLAEVMVMLTCML